MEAGRGGCPAPFIILWRPALKHLTIIITLLVLSACAAHQTPSSAPQEEWLALNRHFISLFTRGDFDQALATAQKEVDLAQGFTPRDNADLATSLNNLGVTYFAMGRFEEAREPLQRALAMREKVLGPNHGEVATTLGNLGELYVAVSMASEAERASRSGRTPAQTRPGHQGKNPG